MNAIERAIKCFGSQAAMASALGVKQPTISEWLRGDRQVPAERCPVIERETRARGDAVLCEELRPDVAWGVLREQVESQTPADPKPQGEHAAACDTRELHSQAEADLVTTTARKTIRRDGPSNSREK